MNPKQKAGEIFDKYFNPLTKLTTDTNYQTYLYKQDKCIQHAKKYALIAVNELIKWMPDKEYHSDETSAFCAEYWEEVKKEIELL